MQRAGQRRQARWLRQAHHRLSAAGGGQLCHPHPGLRARHPPGGAALCEAEILQGLLQGPWQRHRSGGVRRDHHPPRRHLRDRQRRRRRRSGDHYPAHSAPHGASIEIEQLLHFIRASAILTERNLHRLWNTNPVHSAPPSADRLSLRASSCVARKSRPLWCAPRRAL